MKRVTVCVCVCKNSHLRSFGLVLPVKEFGQSSSLDLMDAGRKRKVKVSDFT